MRKWVERMNKAFEKILERLDEELRKSEERYYRYLDDNNLPCMFDKSDIEEKRVDTIKEMLAIVQEVAEEYNGGWIACSERLPEDSGTYIVNAIENSSSHVTFAKWKQRKKKWNLTGCRSYWKVNAWQPLPEPFKERD